MTRNTPAQNLEHALAEAASGRRVILRRGGKRLAIIGAADLARLEQSDADEELADAKAIDGALAELAASGQEPRPLEELLAELGL